MDMTHVNKTRKILYRITLGLLLISTAAVIYVVYLLIRPYQTLALQGPIVITNQPIPAGTLAIYSVDQCRYTTAVAHTIRRLVLEQTAAQNANKVTGSVIYIPLGSSDGHAPVGCTKFSPPPVLIPGDTIPGIYHIEFEIHFQVNPIRDIQVTFQSQPFSVIASIKE